MASGPLRQKTIWPPGKCEREKKKNSFSIVSFSAANKSLGIYCRRNSTSGTASGRIPTQDAYAIAIARRKYTEVSVQSTSFDLPIIYRCFSRMLQPSNKSQGHWNRVPLLCKVQPQYALRFFVGFGSPRKDGRIASLCAERVRFF
ncbi:hypothetical protein AVEN_102631-1 [Araneus ventricosus]|uniref:Uncharacterized protein n=1 Tax=Araneus ventricosus TaxID=182803 RepID=A0A4Y2BKF4_ARAVE|nr:hypothetical protein AVEN_102631-1 [Araneus ventricosus]